MGAENNARSAKEVLSSLRSDERLNSVCHTLLRWVDASRPFAEFIEKHTAKIYSKLRNAAKESNEKVRDVLAELESAYRLAKTNVLLPVYEPYAAERTGNPDIVCRSTEYPPFSVEVKRIREVERCVEFKKSLDSLIDQLRQTRSSLGLFINTIDGGVGEAPHNLPQRLNQASLSLADQCLALIERCERELASGAETTCSVEDLTCTLSITLQKIPDKSSDSPTAWLGRVYTPPYTRQEWRKFSDIILSFLYSRQPRAGMINILMIVLDSEAHEPEDLSKAIAEVWARAECSDDDFFQGKHFEDVQAFLRMLPLLSGILVVSRWAPLDQPVRRNCLWENPDAAMCVPKELRYLLREL